MNKQYKQPEETKVEGVLLNKPNFLKEAIGLFDTVAVVPTGKPTNLVNQIKFYSTGGVHRIYIYDAKNSTWRYSTLT